MRSSLCEAGHALKYVTDYSPFSSSSRAWLFNHLNLKFGLCCPLLLELLQGCLRLNPRQIVSTHCFACHPSCSRASTVRGALKKWKLGHDCRKNPDPLHSSFTLRCVVWSLLVAKAQVDLGALPSWALRPIFTLELELEVAIFGRLILGVDNVSFEAQTIESFTNLSRLSSSVKSPCS